MPETMPAVVNFAREPRSVELREMPIPTIGKDDVLLQVRAASVCGSDLHQWLGGASWHVNYPCVLGHEFGGVIVEVGEYVGGFRPGDRVVSETAAVIDPSSPFTRQGLYNLDPNRLGFGYGVHGAMTHYVRVPARCLHHIPAGLSFEHAALTEPCSVAYNAVCVNSSIRPGDCVLVLGPGPIGLLCALMARLSGAGSLIVAGVPGDETRLDVARQLGATHVVTDDPVACVRGLGDGFGADLVIDAAGVSASLATAIQAVRPAGQITKVGWGPQPLGFSLDPLVQKNVRLQGSFSHNWPIWERILALMASGQLDVTPLISRVGSLQEWESCFAGMHSGKFVKSILLPHGPNPEQP